MADYDAYESAYMQLKQQHDAQIIEWKRAAQQQRDDLETRLDLAYHTFIAAQAAQHVELERQFGLKPGDYDEFCRRRWFNESEAGDV